MDYGMTYTDANSLRRITISGTEDYPGGPSPTAAAKPRKKDAFSRETKAAALGRAVKTLGDTTTAHGLPLVINGTRTPARVLWFVLWLVLFGVAVVQSVLLLADFFVWPTAANIKLVTETNLDFPAVTVCNMNRMRRSELVGTRFEGLIAVDGGISGGDYDYSWFFDWSSEWFGRWESSSSASLAGGGVGSADDSSNSAGESSSAPATGSSSVFPGGGQGSTTPAGGQSQSSPGGAGGSVVEGSSSADDGAGSQVQDASTAAESPEATAGAATTELPDGSSPGPSTAQPATVTATEYLSTAALTASKTDSGQTEGPGASSSSADSGASSSAGPGRRRRSAEADRPESADQSLHQRDRRSALSSSSASSSTPSSNPYWWDSLDFEYYGYYDFDGVTDENDWQGFYSRSKADDFSDLVDVANPTKEELASLGHQPQDFILQCTFDKKNCSYRDFRVFQNREYGNCFTFNHGKDNDTVRKTSKFGAKYGLHLTLFIEQPEYIGLFSPESGVRVTIHDQSTMPLPEDNGLTVPTGLASSVGVRQEYIKRLGLPYGNCSDGTNSDFNSTAADGYSYSLGACSKFCLQEALLERCGCVTDILLDYAPKCSFLNTTQQTCRQAVQTLYEEDRLGCVCHSACSETRYVTSLSSSRWPSERYEEHLHSRISAINSKAARLMQNVEQTRKNMVRLRIYFEELNYQSTIQTEKYSLEGLVGSLGGLFGLYIGFSLFTVAEVALFLLTVVRIVCGLGRGSGNDVKPAVY